MFHRSKSIDVSRISVPLQQAACTTSVKRALNYAGLTVLMGAWAFCAINSVNAEDNKDAQVDEKARMASKQRLEIMQEAIDAFKVTSKVIETPQPLVLGKSPKQRYDDQVRNLLDAGVWRLGESGRPTAFITIELYGAGPKMALLTYEFVSLSEREFQMISAKGPIWNPTVTELSMLPLTDVPPPGDSDKTRLVQMREIARGFVAQQTYKGQKIELRLLPRPIDRYQDEAQKIVDGGVFVYANGTNPELGILIETDGKAWTYGLFRLSTAPIAMEFKGKEIPGIPANAAYGTQRAYTATRHSVRIPE